jgi:DNA-binding transcriptional regulator YdaS (Cro superfamily)
MAEVKRSLLVAVLSPVIGSLYQYFSVTYMPVGLMAESVSQMIAHAIEGAPWRARCIKMYKAEVAPSPRRPELARTEQTYGTSSTAHHLS